MHGAPAFRHDWSWPVLRTSPSAILALDTQAWSPLDLGAPNLYPSVLPLVALEAVFFSLGRGLGLYLLLLTLYSAAGIGTLLLARALGLNTMGCIISAMAYVTAPALYDELIAGHFGDIAVFAALPWLLAACYYRRDLWLPTGAVAAVVMSVQLQGMIIAVLLTLAAAALTRSRQLLLLASSAVASQTISVVSLSSPGATHVAFIAQSEAVLEWVRVQSASLFSALSGRGYAPGYDVSPVLAPLQNFVSLVALPVVWIQRRNKRFWVIFLCYAVGVVIASGLKGPASLLLSWMFVHLTAASVFRELFHAASLIALPIALFFGSLASYITTDRRWFVLATSTISCILFASWAAPALSGTSRWLHGYQPSALEIAFRNKLERDQRPGRFAVFPGRQPYDLNGSIGVDPLTYYQIGNEQPVFNYFPEGVLAFASDAWLSGATKVARALYREMSVEWLLVRTRPRSAVVNVLDPADRMSRHVPIWQPRRPSMQNIHAYAEVRGAGLPILSGGDFNALPSSGNVPLAFMQQGDPVIGEGYFQKIEHSDSVDKLLAEGCARRVEPLASKVYASPRRAWVRSWRYGIESVDAALFPPVITTAALPLPFREKVDKVLASIDGDRYAWYNATDPRLRSASLIAVAIGARVAGRCTPLPQPSRSGVINILSFERTSQTSVSGSLTSSGAPATVIFSDAFDPGWRLYLDGKVVSASQHFHVDGFGNGWVVSTTRGMHSFSIYFAPTAGFNVLLAMQVAVYAAIAFWFLRCILLRGKMS